MRLWTWCSRVLAAMLRGSAHEFECQVGDARRIDAAHAAVVLVRLDSAEFLVARTAGDVEAHDAHFGGVIRGVARIGRTVEHDERSAARGGREVTRAAVSRQC